MVEDGGVQGFMQVMITRSRGNSGKFRKRLQGQKWLVIGNFNDIISNQEKWGGRVRDEWTFKDFRG